MNWEMIAAIAQIVAALGIIGSVIYLSLQVRNQSKETRSATVNILTSQWSKAMATWAASDDFPKIWLRGLQSFDSLDSTSKVRFAVYLNSLFRIFEGLYLHFLDGNLDPRLWRGIDRTIADLVPYPGMRIWWDTRKHWHTDEFCSLVEQHMHKAPEATLYRIYY